jgi:hypothetical protein
MGAYIRAEGLLVVAGSVSRAELVAGSALLDLSYAVLLLERVEQRLRSTSARWSVTRGMCV